MVGCELLPPSIGLLLHMRHVLEVVLMHHHHLLLMGHCRAALAAKRGRLLRVLLQVLLRVLLRVRVLLLL